MHQKISKIFTIFIHLNYLPFLFPEIAPCSYNYSVSLEVPIISEIISAYSAHPYIAASYHICVYIVYNCYCFGSISCHVTFYKNYYLLYTFPFQVIATFPFQVECVIHIKNIKTGLISILHLEFIKVFGSQLYLIKEAILAAAQQNSSQLLSATVLLE